MRPESAVHDVAPKRRLITVAPGDSRQEAARLIGKYNLLALPVVDAGGRLLGIVTVDDVIDAMVAEQTRQVQRMGGMEALDAPYTEIGFAAMVRKRAGWLCALFLGEMLTATAMGYFEHEIERAVVLSLFIPLIISSGGNSGSQATSLIIRALALREVRLGEWWRVAMRELPAGLTLGVILGVIGFARIILWQELGWYDYGLHAVLVATAVALSLVGVVAFGSMAGSMLPFVLRRLGFDPASASAPFVATLVDVTGLVIYFSVAYLVLRGTLLQSRARSSRTKNARPTSRAPTRPPLCGLLQREPLALRTGIRITMVSSTKSRSIERSGRSTSASEMSRKRRSVRRRSRQSQSRRRSSASDSTKRCPPLPRVSRRTARRVEVVSVATPVCT